MIIIAEDVAIAIIVVYPAIINVNLSKFIAIYVAITIIAVYVAETVLNDTRERDRGRKRWTETAKWPGKAETVKYSGNIALVLRT